MERKTDNSHGKKYSLDIGGKIFWICVGLVAIFIRFKAQPEWIEENYSRFFFPVIRQIFDGLFSWLPFPLIYIFFLVLFVVLAKNLFLFFRRKEKLLRKLLRAILSLMAFTGAIVFIFMIMWGYNYGRIAVEKHLNLDLIPLSVEDLRQELEEETATIIRLRSQISNATDSALTITFSEDQLLESIRTTQGKILDENDYPHFNNVRSRLIFPKGVFLHFSSSGLYFPFTAEGHVDAGLHPLQQPYVMAHELAHGQGFGDEGTCNFWAYLTCARSDDPAIAYAGHFAYWRTVAYNYRRVAPKEYEVFRKALPPGIVADLQAIYREMDKYPDIMPKFRTKVYDTYLKTQGIKEGIKNYNRVLMMVKAWKEGE